MFTLGLRGSRDYLIDTATHRLRRAAVNSESFTKPWGSRGLFGRSIGTGYLAAISKLSRCAGRPGLRRFCPNVNGRSGWLYRLVEWPINDGRSPATDRFMIPRIAGGF